MPRPFDDARRNAPNVWLDHIVGYRILLSIRYVEGCRCCGFFFGIKSTCSAAQEEWLILKISVFPPFLSLNVLLDYSPSIFTATRSNASTFLSLLQAIAEVTCVELDCARFHLCPAFVFCCGMWACSAYLLVPSHYCPE